MDTQQQKRFNMFLRVQQFGVEHAGIFAENTYGGRLFLEIGQIVSEMVKGIAGQNEGEKRSALSKLSKAKKALVEDLQAIARTGQTMAGEYPELVGKFRLVTPLANAELLGAARAFAGFAEPYRANFIERNLPANFLEDLEADILVFEAAMRDRIAVFNQRTAASRAIRTGATKGMDSVKRLDAVVRNTFRGNPVKLDEWKRAKALNRVGGRGSVVPTVATATTPAAVRAVSA